MAQRNRGREPGRLRDALPPWWGWLALAFVALLLLIVLLAWSGTIETGFGEYTPDPSIKPSPARAKTLWDWMELLLVPLILAVAAALFTWVTNKREREVDEQRFVEQREIELDRARATVLQTYLDRMTGLLKEGLRVSEPEDEKRHIARVQTLTALRQLDGERKGLVLQFLYESNLVNDKPVVVLRAADLRGATLGKADLGGANLGGVNLSEANLRKANLSWAMLYGADLTRAAVQGAWLVVADLREADLRGAKLQGANLSWAKLRGTALDDTTELGEKWRLVWSIVNQGSAGRDLHGVDVGGADLHATDLSGANLSGANLAMAILTMARLQGADLGGANLHGADLRGANLQGAKVTREQLDLAEALTGAVLPDGTVHD